MEWVEFTARTLEEAKDLALDRLGVAADDAEFEVLAEPKPGLFGRLRGEARVRARVRPAQARQKVDRRERRLAPIETRFHAQGFARQNGPLQFLQEVFFDDDFNRPALDNIQLFFR